MRGRDAEEWEWRQRRAVDAIERTLFMAVSDAALRKIVG
jgi:hypothetical protein